MTEKKVRIRPLPPGAIDFAITILSAMAIVLVFCMLFVDLSPDMLHLLLILDTFICLIFQTEFLIGLLRSKDRRAYLRIHWIDSAASIPLIEHMRWARVFQLLRIVRLYRELKRSMERLRQERGQLTLAGAILILVVMLGTCAIAILAVEGGQEGPITTAGDALWWSIVTVSTVGYGDYYPITPAGKVIASILILTGVTLFGLLSGYMASLLLAGLKKEQAKTEELVEEDLQLDAEMKRYFEQIESRQSAQLRELTAEVRQLRQEVAQLKKGSGG